MNVTYKIPQSVLVVIYTKELDVLLIERADRPGFWQSVTGSRDSLSEPLEQTAVREVFEETGIRIVTTEPHPERHEVSFDCLCDWKTENVFEIFSVWRHRFAPGVTENTEHVYGLLVPEKFPVVLAPKEHLNAVWLPYREAAAKCFSYTNRDAILQLPDRSGCHG
ncbi:MAG: dihydroneopterin triphosphate diphosphatase [Oxalobacter sp.]|uniref:dihydroneopterin triphosphate diphosphatase n=1 Tax=Oxalobacter paeniformigenes TaxID=2946594 RepID=UPI0022AF7E1B|nr:dihydroneopterin triphosphate diphosphatase [Oxalobacter paeniformigenes]MBS7405294.1 dihydroneopterin triphosphate diphosphatase [Oxalobacter sp.]MCZ4053521.1 dihydroneopterin triphosphate diphosphatase [Oxalobacter paeniformigenes]